MGTYEIWTERLTLRACERWSSTVMGVVLGWSYAER